MELRTILNISFRTVADSAAAPAPSSTLFRLGEASREDGEWGRWGTGLLVAVLLHLGAVLVGLAPSRPVPARVLAPEAPELVFLRLAPPPPPAGALASVAAAPERVKRQARTRPSRPAAVHPAPVPLPTPAPAPVEPEPVVEAPVETAAVGPEATQDAAPEALAQVGTGGTGSVIAGVVGGVLGGREGGLVGATEGTALELTQVARPPAVLEQVAPRYPRQARSRGIQGLVLVRIILGTDGRVEAEHTRVLRSVAELDAAAVSAVSRWRFSPALGHHGRPVRVILEVPIQFSLQ